MKDFSIDLTFWQCAGINGLSDLKQILRLINSHGFEFEQNTGEFMKRVKTPEETDLLAEGHYRAWKQNDKTGETEEWSFFARSRPSSLAGLIGSFAFEQFHRNANRLTLNGLIDLEYSDQSGFIEPFSQALLQLAKPLYETAKPALGWIDGNYKNTTNESDVKKHNLKVISWINLFSPVYVSQYGKDTLLRLPGYETELLNDGGVFHRLSESIAADHKQHAAPVRKASEEYWINHGRKVKCCAPYIIPDKISPSKTHERIDFQKMIRTTLVLDDGTRVKPVYLPWNRLNAAEKKRALKAVQDAIRIELKTPAENKRFIVEFQEIPGELLGILENLSVKHPNLAWIINDRNT